MHKLRVSYSLLNIWARGQYDQAVSYYLHLPTPTSQAMEDGNIWDAHITEWADLYKKLPEEFGGDTLLNPKCQEKIVIPYNDLCDLVIKPDIIDEPVLWENKTGNSKDSGDYAIDFQVAMYFLGLKNIEYAIINHYNQYTGELDRSLIWNTSQERNRGKNFIDTLVPEIHTYFLENGIFYKMLDKKKNLEYNKV